MAARDVVLGVSQAIIPMGARLPFIEVLGARYEGRNRITAEVVMFDGQHARMHLHRWAHGWSHGWDSMPGGDISLEATGWKRVEAAPVQMDLFPVSAPEHERSGRA